MGKLTKQQRKDNTERTTRGGDVLRTYSDNYGEDDDQTTLTDVLSDLMHYSQVRWDDRDCPMNFYDALRVARMHFEAEQEGKG
jgi:hypothetical protein